MINLSDCKFGDKLKTRDGRMAVFLGASFRVARGFDCAIEDQKHSYFTMLYRKDGKTSYSSIDEDYDIIGKWEDEMGKPATPYELKPDMPKAIKPIKGVSEAMVEQWLQDIKHLK